eukprot:10766429-Karenia_brevis.AAC.1
MEQDERYERLAALVATEDSSQEGIMFLIRVEQLIPQYREQYADHVRENQDRDTGPLGPLHVWAQEMMGRLDSS